MSQRRRSLTIALFTVVVLAAAGCGGADDGAEKFSDVGSAIASDGGWSERSDGSDGSAEGIYLEDEERVAAPGTTGGSDAAPYDAPEIEVAQPTAGSVDDNALWDEYLRYRDEFLVKGIPVSDLPVGGRQLLTVLDGDGDPVLGATITVVDAGDAEVARLRTYADGRAVFLAGTEVDPTDQSRPAYRARVSAGNVADEFALEPGVPAQTLRLDGDVAAPAQVDVMFLIDATGSMVDEIERLKASMISVAEQIDALPGAPDARFSMVVYRDRGDDFVTRTFDFTGDVIAFTDALAEVVADGGGDTPEALGSGLAAAVDGPSWRGDDTVKLLFLVADAAPHLAGEPGYEDEPDYAATLREAAARGIKIFPVASRGLDVQGEFVFRQLGQVTMGRFVFLTYGPDGASPGESTPHDVDPDDYDVLPLDALVVRLVSDELEGLPR